MSKKVLLGIDAGTSSLKVCAFYLSGEIAGRVSKQITLRRNYNHPEVDVEDYWNTLCQALREITCKYDFEVLSIGFSTTAPTVIVMDGNYNALRYGIPYLNNRASNYVNGYVKNIGDIERFYNKVGNSPATSTCSFANLLWIKEHEPDIWKEVKHVGMLNSFFAAKMTGCSAIDPTQASYTGVFDLKKEDEWDPYLIDKIGLDDSLLLPIKECTERIGSVNRETAEITGLRLGTPIALGSADTAAAAFGIGFKHPDTAFESAGTSGVLSFVLERPHFNPVFMNRRHVFPGMWLAHGAMSMMGGALDWLRNNVLSDIKTPEQLDDIANRGVPGANGLVFLPYLSGERCPVWDPDALGVWFGLKISTNEIDLVESVYESSAFALRQIYEEAKSSLGADVNSIVAVGNGTKSSYWNQLKANILEVEYQLSNVTEAAAFGAAIMGGIAAGVYKDLNDKNIPVMGTQMKIYHPVKIENHLAYETSYRIYKELYPSLKHLMQTAN
jgi:xylulokinase